MKKIWTHGYFKGGKMIHTLRFKRKKYSFPKKRDQKTKSKHMTFKRTLYRHITWKKYRRMAILKGEK
jgi:hypothetical protein